MLAFLKKQYASSPNKQFASADVAGLQAAWGAKWKPGTPFTMVIAPGGKVLYQKEGKIDILEVRRTSSRTCPTPSPTSASRRTGRPRSRISRRNKRLAGIRDPGAGSWKL